MITLEKIRGDMEKQLDTDRSITTVEVQGDSLEECLADAAVQLDTKVAHLEYEVEEKGFSGVMGLAKKPWKVRVYENPEITQEKIKMQQATMGTAGAEGEEEAAVVDQDGIYYIHRFSSHICIKVMLPVGTGHPVNPDDAISECKRPDTLVLDENQIRELCETGTDNQYVEVGEYAHDSVGDALIVADVPDDEMVATITVTPPTGSGAEISRDQILRVLATQRVNVGISEERIQDFLDHPIYNQPVVIAEAVKPKDGRDAYIDYKFDTNTSKMRLKESSSGQVDFKELNLIQNVMAGEPLAVKMLPERGSGGKTVKGRYLEAKNGKDINILLGQNVKFDSDGRTIVAEKSGQVMLVGNKITVEEIYEVPGVNIKTGNVDFWGTVICRGSVEDGYNIKATGNVEIYGSVGNCQIEAGGDIVIAQGVMGRDEGKITTPKSVWARFIQNETVSAGEYVIVNDNIMNSQITAQKKILLKGKRAQITGGHLFATEEISAKNIGSPGGGTETVLEVGIDPAAKQRLLELQQMQADLVKELEEVDMDLTTLENNKKIRRSLPKEKEEQLAKLYERKSDLVDSNEDMTEEITKIQAHLGELKIVGRVNASGTVYAGTKIFVRDEKDEVKSDCKAVCFYYENGFVRRGKFDPAQVTQDIEGPDGYSTN